MNASPSGDADAIADAAREVDFGADLSFVGQPTGGACVADGDCAKSLGGPNTAPSCLKTADGLTWPNGYCSSPCRLSVASEFVPHPDCPSRNGLCLEIAPNVGRCMERCPGGRADCRYDEGYVCENTPDELNGVCIPKRPGWCDPENAPLSCPDLMGRPQHCASKSPNHTAGACELQCDVFLQDCKPLGMRAAECVASSYSIVTGCNYAGTLPEGARCKVESECLPGSACHAENGMLVCRQYCRQGATEPDVPCPMGQSCTQIAKQWQISRVGICSK